MPLPDGGALRRNLPDLATGLPRRRGSHTGLEGPGCFAATQGLTHTCRKRFDLFRTATERSRDCGLSPLALRDLRCDASCGSRLPELAAPGPRPHEIGSNE